MDMNIDTEALTSGMDSMSEIVNRLNSVVSFMMNALRQAGEDFDTINYYRIEQSLNDATNSINNFNNKLNVIKRYLQRLEDIVNRYDGCRF